WLKRYASLRGYVDVLDRYHVAGWAAHGGIAPTLSIRVNGDTVARTVPSYDRPDLAKHYPQNTKLGFDIAFPEPLSEGALVSVTDSRGRELRNSPRRVAPESEPEDLSDVIADLKSSLPPRDLIFLVNGHRDRRQYAVSRRGTVNNIIELLREVGTDFKSFKSILDFGCGCGRVLSGWENILANDVRLAGCDINPKLVDFCVANISFANTFVSNYLPPLNPVSDNDFDFVYAASVFTHLTEAAAKAWAKEFARITRPGGILMMSFHG